MSSSHKTPKNRFLGATDQGRNKKETWLFNIILLTFYENDILLLLSSVTHYEHHINQACLPVLGNWLKICYEGSKL